MDRREPQAFTIVEMLVSVAVLVMLVFLVSQLFNSASATAAMSRKHVDADEAAREVFDRMGADLAGMVRRPDINYIFCKNQGGTSTTGSSDAMFFYSEGPGIIFDPGATSTMSASGSASSLALVGYRVNPNNQYYPGIPVLERLGESLTWGGTPDTTGMFPGGPVFLTYPLTSPATTLAGNWSVTLGSPPYNAENDTEHYQVLSEMAFRMEFSFLLRSVTYSYAHAVNASTTTTLSTTTSGTCYSATPTAMTNFFSPYLINNSWPYITINYLKGGAYPSIGGGGGWREPAGNVYGFPPDLAGIVVTIAVMDKTTRKLVSSAAINNLATNLPDAFGTTPANAKKPTSQVWQGLLSSPSLAGTVGLPQSALQQVRVYERTFYLNAN